MVVRYSFVVVQLKTKKKKWIINKSRITSSYTCALVIMTFLRFHRKTQLLAHSSKPPAPISAIFNAYAIAIVMHIWNTTNRFAMYRSYWMHSIDFTSNEWKPQNHKAFYIRLRCVNHIHYKMMAIVHCIETELYFVKLHNQFAFKFKFKIILVYVLTTNHSGSNIRIWYEIDCTFCVSECIYNIVVSM